MLEVKDSFGNISEKKSLLQLLVEYVLAIWVKSQCSAFFYGTIPEDVSNYSLKSDEETANSVH